MEDETNYVWRFGFNNILRLLLTEWLRSLRYTYHHSRFLLFRICSFPLSSHVIEKGLGTRATVV
jgi:hypothetical protein